MRRSSGAPRPDIFTETPAQREQRLWPRFPRVEHLAFRRAPLLAAAVCFALGVALPKLTPPATRTVSLLAAATLACTALAALALRRSLRLAVVPVCALWIVVGLWSAQIEPYPSAQSRLTVLSDGLSRTVRGHVMRIRELPARDQTDPTADAEFNPDRWDEPGEGRLQLDLALTAIEELTPDTSTMVPIEGGVRLTLLEPAPAATAEALRCGDVVEVPARLRTPPRFRDPGVFQYAEYLLEDDPSAIVATASVPAAKLRRDAGMRQPASAARVRCQLLAAQTWAAARMDRFVRSRANRVLPAPLRLSREDAATLNAMLFGDRSQLTHTLRLGFERTGSFHLFVVSGMHVALLAGILFWMTQRLRLNRWLATLLILACTSAYALLTGFGVPVRRALLMTAVFLAARLLFRERIALNALGAAALAVLVSSPRTLFESSFQMTLLAILAIAGIATPLAGWTLAPLAYSAGALGEGWKDRTVPPRFAQLRVMLRLWGEMLAGVAGPRVRPLPAALYRAALWLAELALVGIVAECVMVLPMALYFHRATVFALPANMASVPLVGIIAPLCLVVFCLSLVSPWLAAVPGAVAALLLHLVARAIALAAHTRYSDLRAPGPVLVRSLVALACVAAACWTVRRSRRWALSALALLPCAAALVLWPHAMVAHRGELEVTAIDVGQGDSILVVAPDGHTMLVDAGGPTGAAARAENSEGAAAFDVGEQVVSPYLWSRQIRTLDVLVLSHAHSDHMGGMPAILRNFHPRELWVGIDPASSAYRDLLDEARATGTVIRHLHAADALAWDATSVAVLSPSAGYTNSGAPSNNDSLVLRIQFGRASVLLEGDAEALSEHAIVASGLLQPVTLLKVGHHGSRTSTTPDLLAAAAPQDAIISVGRQNTFGHPRREIIERLAEAHTRVFRTDEFGLTTFLLSRDGRISALDGASER
ncbi:MAG: ComEC/Rec2 family competence protein [Acidobacteriota bacterium]|nr:ComEC/Rec2 family competence protein [Acidobacteriota bacterium]